MRLRIELALCAGLWSAAACSIDVHTKKANPQDAWAPNRHQWNGPSSSSSDNGGGTPWPDDAGQPSDAGNPVDGSQDAERCAELVKMDNAKELPNADGGELHISGVVKVHGAVELHGDVTIDAGTTFIMAAQSSLEFGASKATSLHAVGNEREPIRFCGAQPGPGVWNTLRFSKGISADSSIAYVVVSDGGGKDTAVHLDAALSIDHLSVLGSDYDGIWASVLTADGCDGISIDGVGRDAVVLSSREALAAFPRDTVFGHNQNNLVRFSLGSDGHDGIAGGVLRIKKLDVPYAQEGALQVSQGAQLQFEAGVDYMFAQGASLEIGAADDKVELQLLGSASDPIMLRGEQSQKGYFQGIWIRAAVSDDSLLAHVRIQHGGANDQPPLSIEAPITLQDVEVKDCAEPVEISAPLNPASRDLTIVASGSYPLQVSPQALTSLPQGGSFSGNAHDQILVSDGGAVKITGTVANLGVPYLIAGQLSLEEGSDITFQPGVEWIWQSGKKCGLEVGWNGNAARITAIGSADAPISFHADSDGVGAWTGIHINASASSESRLDHVRVANAGLSLGLPLTVTNSTFSKSDTYGITKLASDTNDYKADNQFSGNAKGDVGTF